MSRSRLQSKLPQPEHFNDVKDIDMAIIVALVFRLSQSCRSALAVESGSNGISNNMLTFQEPINTI